MKHIGIELEERKVKQRLVTCNERTGSRVLDLSRLNLVKVPSDVGSLRSLRTLSLRSNKLEVLPSQLWRDLPDLEKLDLSLNRISSVPPEIFSLEKINRLVLSGNRLTFLPDEIGRATSMIELFIDHNNLHELPTSISELGSLRVLSVAFNRISEIPSSFKQLRDLNIVDLEGNKISFAPEEIKRLHNIHQLRNSKQKRKELISRALKIRTAKSIQCQRELEARAVAEADARDKDA